MPGYGGGKSHHNPTTKIFVGHLPETCRRSDLLAEFEKFGKVNECDIVKDYAFVHFENNDDAKQAVAALDGAIFHGSNLRVQFSTSSVRQHAGMGSRDSCFRCGGTGHWSKECPSYPSEGSERRSFGRGRGGGGRMHPYPVPPRIDYRDLYRNLYREHYLSLLDRYRSYPEPYGDSREPYFSDPYDPMGPEAIEAIAERRALRMAAARLDPYESRPAPGPSRDSMGRPPPDYYNQRGSRSNMYTSFESPSGTSGSKGGGQRGGPTM